VILDADADAEADGGAAKDGMRGSSYDAIMRKTI
jgi:hypothetical protein